MSDLYIPSEAEQIEYAKQTMGELYFDFMHKFITNRKRLPLRYPKTFWALLWISKAQPSFITGIGVICVFSRQSRDTVGRGLNDLDRDHWINREHRHDPAGHWWIHSRYFIPRLQIT